MERVMEAKAANLVHAMCVPCRNSSDLSDGQGAAMVANGQKKVFFYLYIRTSYQPN